MAKEKEGKKVINLTIPLLVVMAMVASFLGGTYWMKQKDKQPVSEEEKTLSAESSPAIRPTQPPFEAKKSALPNVKFFVMSFCPYGNQAEEGLKPVYELLGDQVEWEPVYIVSDAKQSCEQQCAYSVFNEEACQQYIDQGRVPDMETCREYFPYDNEQACLAENCAQLKTGEYTSLHGEQELNQNVRELCAWQQDTGQKWWNFVDSVNTNCTYEDADVCWEAQAQTAGLSVAEIKTCEVNQAATLLKGQTEISGQYGVSGSPTVYINDVLYNGGRAPEDYKVAICDSFENPPEECGTSLGDQTSGATGGC